MKLAWSWVWPHLCQKDSAECVCYSCIHTNHVKLHQLLIQMNNIDLEALQPKRRSRLIKFKTTVFETFHLVQKKEILMLSTTVFIYNSC